MKSMKTVKLTSVMVAAAAFVLVGCDSGGTPDDVGTARMALSNQSDSASSVRVLVTNETSGEFQADETFDLAAQSETVAEVAVDPGSHVVDVEVIDRASGEVKGAGTAAFEIAGGQVAELRIAVEQMIEASGEGESASDGESGAEGSADSEGSTEGAEQQAVASVEIDVSVHAGAEAEGSSEGGEAGGEASAVSETEGETSAAL
ncbi:MAG: hypothetical protein ACQEXJ_08945 [Myxococcota bacterium]